MKKISLLVHGDQTPKALEPALRKQKAEVLWWTDTNSLNSAAGKATGDYLLLLAAKPAPGWIAEMEKALGTADLVVGETDSVLPGKPTPHGKLALRLFKGHSRRAAEAKGHALPWGPFYNLGLRRELFLRIGAFSTVAGGAFDIDWCWRAVLAGARLSFAPKARATRERANTRAALLTEFDAYGQGEAWLHGAFSFLLEHGAPADSLLTAIDGYTRLRHHSQAAKAASLAIPLEETAAAFAAGVRLGFGGWKKQCPLPRPAPALAISWVSGKKEQTIFVPGKGLTTLDGKALAVWTALRDERPEAELVKLVRRLFKASAEDAAHVLTDFRGALSPALGGSVRR